MLIIYLVVLILNIVSIIECTCISNNNNKDGLSTTLDIDEPIVGAGSDEDLLHVRICLDYKLNNYRYCIRSIDNTGNYSPYLDIYQDITLKDDSSNTLNVMFNLIKNRNSLFKMRLKDDNIVTFQNAANNLYLASLPNGFIYYSPTDDSNSQWWIGKNNGKTIKNVNNGRSLYNVDNFKLEAKADSYTNFNLITLIQNKENQECLGICRKCYYADFHAYMYKCYKNYEYWILDCVGNKLFYLQHEYLLVYLADSGYVGWSDAQSFNLIGSEINPRRFPFDESKNWLFVIDGKIIKNANKDKFLSINVGYKFFSEWFNTGVNHNDAYWLFI